MTKIANSHSVPKKQWNKWNENQRVLFDLIYRTATQDKRPVQPLDPAIPSEHLEALGWNIAWLVADEYSCAAEADQKTAALISAREAIASLPIDALGGASDGQLRWPIRDELVDNLTKAINGNPVAEQGQADG